MSIQDRNALALDALSIIKDAPPNAKQPPLEDGIHLRWAPGDNRDFPLKGGYYLFRRRVGRPAPTPACVMAHVKNLSLGVVAQEKSIDTGIGVLAGGSGTLLQPVVLPGTSVITGLAIGPQGVLFTLPPNTTASGFTVQISLYDLTAPEVVVAAYLRGVKVASQKTTPPPYQQTITITVNPPGADSIAITASGPLAQPIAELLELCYTPTAKPLPTAAPQSTAASLPGTGWQQIPNLFSVITLPLRHPLYPANPGTESINTSIAVAKSRVLYGKWENSFGTPTATTPGVGTITLTNGSPIATGAGTNWTTGLVGSLLQLPLTGTDYTAYAIMAVLAPGYIVLSRAYSGTRLSTTNFQFTVGDDFAELHDRIASLLESPNDMRAAVVPPPLDQGTVAGGKCLLVLAGGSTQITGIGTQWNTNLTGCFIEIGPTWFQTTNLTGSTTYRVQAVNSAVQQITLDRPFVGLPFLVPAAKCDYRIFARTVGDDPNAGTPFFDFKPMDLLELASLVPAYAQALGLYWVDTSVLPGDVFDYIVIADDDDRFAHSVNNALNWLNGPPTPDFTGSAVDGWAKYAVAHSGSPPLAAPSQMKLFRLDTGGARISIAHPNRADSDVGVSVPEAANWPAAAQPAPVMLNLWRLARGTDASNLLPVGTNANGYQDLHMLLAAPPDPSGASNKAPPNWPAVPIHFVDSGGGTGLDVGWYSYRGNAIDLFGRYSPDSAPIPWSDVDNSPTTITDAIHLADTTPPPPPAGVTASFLDDRDPYMLQDTAFTNWRSHFPGATEWAAWQPGNPYPSIAPAIGLRLSFRWPWAAQNQGPDLGEFRVYALEEPLNARPGQVTSVTAASATSSSVTLNIGSADTKANYAGATLQAGKQAYAITASQSGDASHITSVVLTVTNGGTNQLTSPDSNVDGAIVIPDGHPLAKQLLSPANWEWQAAIPKDVGVQYGVEMVVDPSKPTDNPGAQGSAGQWTSSTRQLVLDGAPNLTNVNLGADLVYVAPSGVTPDQLNYFFSIESLVGNTLTLIDNGNLSALPSGPLPWKIGRPVRYYEVFLPSPAAGVVVSSLDASTLLNPTSDEPVRHGTIAVSSADYRTEIPDKYWPSRGRTGNESLLAGPAPVFRVLRDPVETPKFTWNVTRLYATKANYKDESYFTVRWNKPVNAKSAHVYKAMDSTIFVAHWRLTSPLTPPGTPVPPPAIPAFLASFNTYKTSNNYTAAAALYNQLDDVTLWWLASQPELADAYMQMTITPLDLSDLANADRLGLDDPSTYVTSSNVRAYTATLAGRSTNRYFFCVMLLDGAQNRSSLGLPTPPVYLPRVVPPRTPVITKVLGGERQVTIQWAANREPDLAGYRVYRTDDAENAKDLRSMDLAATITQADINLSDPSAQWVDSANLVGGRKYYYRLTAADTVGNESEPTRAQVGVAVDTREPRPEWTEQTWLLHRKAYDAFTDWPADGIVPAGYEPVLRLGWQCDIPDPQFVLRRMRDPETTWSQPNKVVTQPSPTGAFAFILFDYDADPTLAAAYRLKVRSPRGVWSANDALLVISLPGSGGQ
jgi:hypothetical protein